jgi:hypothetical protein
MVNENLVNKVDKTVKRGSKTYYSLRDNARKQHQLRILKVDKDYETKRSIYQLLVYFHSFKRGELLKRRQLNKKLLEFGLRFEDFQQINRKQHQVSTPIDNMKYTEVKALLHPIRNIGIVEYRDNNKNSHLARNNIVYYLYLPGFTAMEFIMYLKKLGRRKEPRSFSHFPPLIPYVYYRNFTDTEIEEAIQLFYKSRLIRIIPSVFVGETRYYLSDDSLIRFIAIIIYIQEITVHKTLTKLTYIEKPDDNDRQVLGLYFGRKGTDFTLAKAHEIRKDLRKKPGTQAEGKKIIQEYDDQICSLMNYLDEIYGNKFEVNELSLDLIVNFPIINQN